jgi:hypothetical protein
VIAAGVKPTTTPRAAITAGSVTPKAHASSTAAEPATPPVSAGLRVVRDGNCKG